MVDLRLTWARLRCAVSIFRRAAKCEMVCVIPPSDAPQWILNAICREIKGRVSLDVEIAHCDKPLPQAGAYFFSHLMFFHAAILRTPEILRARNIVFYTHPKEGLSRSETVRVLNLASHVACMCTEYAEMLKAWGVKAEKVATVHVGADPRVFVSHVRGRGKIGFCSAYYERKNPALIVEIVRRSPDWSFMLVGRNWEKCTHFQQLMSLSNFQYRELHYNEYPSFYESLDVFVSPSRIEGGPVPLLEAMMSNVYPVASRTGHAADLITHGKNGFLFDQTSR